MNVILDSTLREIGLMNDIRLSRGQSLEIIRRLVSIGITEIDLGLPSTARMSELIADVRQIAPDASLALWSQNDAADICQSAELCPDQINISLPVSDVLMHKLRNCNREQLLFELSTVLGSKRAYRIPSLTVYFEDATRADPEFLTAALRVAEANGAHRVCLSDTFGVATPSMMLSLLELAKTAVALPLGVRARNNFGMATANAITALEAGAVWVDVTILGLGKRTGNARLEEIIGYLADKHQQLSAKLTQLTSLCRIVARMVGIHINPHTPIIGTRIDSDRPASLGDTSKGCENSSLAKVVNGDDTM